VRPALPLFKYFLCAGTLLTLLLYGWGEYLKPAATKTRGVPDLAHTAEVFRPTPAPPIVEDDQLRSTEASGPAAEPAVETDKPTKTAKAARGKPKKQKVRVARRHPQDSVAYFSPRPFSFFDWR
jgi:hypothetical protein